MKARVVETQRTRGEIAREVRLLDPVSFTFGVRQIYLLIPALPLFGCVLLASDLTSLSLFLNILEIEIIIESTSQSC